MPSSPFNVTWTVAITSFLSTLAFAKLPPEIVVASYNTGLTVGAFTATPTGCPIISGPISRPSPCSSTKFVFGVSALEFEASFAFTTGASNDNIIINESSATEIFLEILTFSLNNFINFAFKFICSFSSYFFNINCVLKIFCFIL